ncbi:MAG: hypothetical protein ACREGR_01115 [Minisyncoccia bacterium]
MSLFTIMGIGGNCPQYGRHAEIVSYALDFWRNDGKEEYFAIHVSEQVQGGVRDKDHEAEITKRLMKALYAAASTYPNVDLSDFDQRVKKDANGEWERPFWGDETTCRQCNGDLRVDATGQVLPCMNKYCGKRQSAEDLVFDFGELQAPFHFEPDDEITRQAKARWEGVK